MTLRQTNGRSWSTWKRSTHISIISICRPSFRENLMLICRCVGLWAGCWWIGRSTLTLSWTLELLRNSNQCFASSNCVLQSYKTPNCVQLLDCHQTWLWPSTFVQCADLKKSLFILTTVATARWCSILSCNDNKYRNDVTLYLLTNVGCNQKGEKIHKSKSTLSIRI